jgi:WD40 repeat protein
MPVFPVANKPAVLARIQADEKPLSLIPPSYPEARASTSSIQGVLFAGNGGGVAYTAGKDGQGYVVHNGKPGSLYKAFGSVVLSPDGSRIAYAAVVGDKWRMVVDGEAGELFDEINNPLFSSDGRNVVYRAMKDGVRHLVVDTTVNKGTRSRYRTPQFSGDSASLIYIDNIDDTDKGRLVVCDISFNKERIINSGVTSFVLNSDKSAVAAISRSKANRERIIQFNFAKPDAVMKGTEYDSVRGVVFAPAGTDLAYFGERQGKIYGVFNGQEEILPEGLMPGTSVINQAGKSVGVLMSANNTVYLYQMFRNSGRVGDAYDEAEWLVFSNSGSMSAFTARKGESWRVVVNGIEGPKFDRVVTPKFSPDGKYLVYRARKEGKRFVVIADASGKVLRQHPAYEQVFDVQFTSDGRSVAYGVKDGNKLIWKVEKL